MIVDLLPSPPESFIRNCLIRCKPDDDNSLFMLQDGLVIARLDNYAIIPRDEYDELEAKLYYLENLRIMLERKNNED